MKTLSDPGRNRSPSSNRKGVDHDDQMDRAVMLKRLTRMETSGIQDQVPKRCKFPKKIRFPSHWLMDKGPQ